MFDYISQKITDTPFHKTFENRVSYLELNDFFTNDHFEKLCKDVYNSKHLTMDEYPVDGEAPSVISFADMIDNVDSDDYKFYEELYNHFSSKELKCKILKKFGLNDNVEAVERKMTTTVSFHTEYPHQFDCEHTDQKDNLFTISLQVYLPEDDKLKDYGTKFYDELGNIIHTTQFLPNTGYCFLATNNSWHSPIIGAERKSFFVRYAYSLNVEKTRTIFNYNPDNKTCVVVWNKDMDVYHISTDWTAVASLHNTIEHNIENVTVTQEPFKRDLEVLLDLKNQGFKKAIVYFGGMIWHTNKFFEHIKNLDMKELVFGGLNHKNDQLLRQYFVINLERLREIPESYARGKFFEEAIENDDYTSMKASDSGGIINKTYYHPEPEEAGAFGDYIKYGTSKIPQELKEEFQYLDEYRTNHNNLFKLVSKISQF